MLKAIVLGRVTYDINLLVDAYPTEGSSLDFFDRQANGGGAAANIAYALAKWGISTSFAGVLGNDVFGSRIKKEFESVNVDTRYIEQSYDNDTPLTINIINKTNKNHTVLNVADKYIGLKKCDFDFTPDLIVCDGYDVVQAKSLLERFPKVTSVLDASIITNSVLELMRKAKYTVCTKEFAEAATGSKIDLQNLSTLVVVYEKLKKKFLNTQLVITLGAAGVAYQVNLQTKIMPIVSVPSVDTTGCGSIFRAGFAFSIAQNNDIEKAVKMGTIAAGLSTLKYGGRPSIPTYEEMNKIYEQNY